MRLTLAMPSLEIGMMMGQDGTLVGGAIRENLRIVDALASSTSFLDRPRVVPEAAQLLDNGQREILIRIEPGHEWLFRLVVPNVLVDLGGMLSVIIPGRKEISRRQADDIL